MKSPDTLDSIIFKLQMIVQESKNPKDSILRVNAEALVVEYNDHDGKKRFERVARLVKK